MPVILSLVIVIAFLGTIYPQKDIPKGEMLVYMNMKGVKNPPIRQNIKPQSEYEFKNVIKQEFDYSCGSAALATLINYYLKEKLNEQQVIQGLMQYGETSKIAQRRAFSLLDMKRFVEVLGYNGSGYKAELDDLKALNKPAIVPIELSGYKHFVVYRGIYGDHIFFADPFRGNTSFTIEQFLKIWSQNIVFVVSSDRILTNALRLKNEDLRIIEFDMEKHAVPSIFPAEMVSKQREFQESQGHTFYKTLDIR